MKFYILSIWAIAFLFLFPDRAEAEISRLRAIGLFGVGNSWVKSFGGSRKSYTESPFGGSGGIEYYISPLIGLGVEHMRSYGNNQTGFGLTGAVVRLYFWNDHPQYFTGILSGDSGNPVPDYGYYQIHSISPFVGFAGGFAQATIPRYNVMALNEYLNFKFGFDYNWASTWGLRTEANVAFAIAGSGNINMFNLIFGIYFFL